MAVSRLFRCKSFVCGPLVPENGCREVPGMYPQLNRHLGRGGSQHVNPKAISRLCRCHNFTWDPSVLEMVPQMVPEQAPEQVPE